MRTVTFGCACSLDQFIARPDHSVDFLLWSDDVAAFTAEYWKTIDTVVMGRKTYEVAARMGTTAYPGVRNVVFSRTLARSPHPKVEVVAGDAVAFFRDLKNEAGKGICVMGGGELAKSFFEAGLIDEVGLNIQPVLLGAGIPLFHGMSRQQNLELLEARTLSGGCLLVRYRVNR
jgi:dihydrofolate reductase